MFGLDTDAWGILGGVVVATKFAKPIQNAGQGMAALAAKPGQLVVQENAVSLSLMAGYGYYVGILTAALVAVSIDTGADVLQAFATGGGNYTHTWYPDGAINDYPYSVLPRCAPR